MITLDVRNTAILYATEVLGWKKAKPIGCLPKNNCTHLVAVEGEHNLKGQVQTALLIDGEEVAAEMNIVDYLAEGGVLKPDEPPTKPPESTTAPLFHTGPVVATPGALEALERNGSNGEEYLLRHVSGDWGEVDGQDKAANDEALKTGARIMSVYTLRNGTKMWIITDAEINDDHHRQATTFLLPDEY